MPDTAHIFALFYEQLPVQACILSIRDADPLFHRIVHVLRLDRGDSVIFFNRERNARAIFARSASRELFFEIHEPVANKVYQPKITCLLPLLKREAFDEAVYSTTECGVSAIQPVITQKVHRSWGGDKERDRVMRVIIAAAEQSKHYAVPEFYEPKKLSEVLDKYEKKSTIVWCDPSGSPLSTILAELKRNRPDHVAVLVGPEGDLTADEKKILLEKSIMRMTLTPTILRAHQAVMLAVGVLRSDLNS